MYEDLFYERLTHLRNERNVSARDMSLSLGQSPGYISWLERRSGLPSMNVFFYICEYFGVSPSEFFDEADEHPVEVHRICERLPALNKEQLDALWALICTMN